MVVALNRRPCSLSATHQPSATPFPAVTEGSSPDDRRLLSAASFVYARHAETAVIVVEGSWMTPYISSVAGRRSGIATLIRGNIDFATEGLG